MKTLVCQEKRKTRQEQILTIPIRFCMRKFSFTWWFEPLCPFHLFIILLPLSVLIDHHWAKVKITYSAERILSSVGLELEKKPTSRLPSSIFTHPVWR